MSDDSVLPGERAGAAAERSGSASAPPPSRRGPRPDAVLFGLILAASLVAYVWSASFDLGRGRFYDERFSMENVEAALTTGSLRPANGWYSRLSYLPQTAVLAASGALAELTGVRSLAVIDATGRATATAYLLSRLVSVAYGLAALWLTWRLGRQLFSRPVALLGTFVMAVTPWQIRASVEFKPDALLLMTTLLAMLWLLETARRPSAGTYLKSGLGVGLALSSKLNGGVIAVPLILLTALRRRLRHWLWLVLAGATALGVFLAIHQPLGYYWGYFRRVHRFYNQGPESFGAVLSGELSLLLAWEFHGRVMGSVALLGLALLLGRLLRRRVGGVMSFEQMMFLSFPIVYAIAFAASSSRAKSNNLVQLVPFTSLAAGWMLHRIWRWLTERRPALDRPAVGWTVVAAGATLLLVPAVSFVIYIATVTTVAQANHLVLTWLPFTDQRLVAHEPLPEPLALAAMELESFAETPRRELDLTDAEVFPASRLVGRGQGFYLGRLVRLDPNRSRVAILTPRWSRVRGPDLVVLVHPLKPKGAATTFELRLRPAPEPHQRVYKGRLPEAVRALELVSFRLEPPPGVSIAELQLGRRPMRLFPLGGNQVMTNRLRVKRVQAPLRLRLAEPAPAPATLAVTVWRWRDPPDSLAASAPEPRQGPPSEAPAPLAPGGISDRPGRGGG